MHRLQVCACGRLRLGLCDLGAFVDLWLLRRLRTHNALRTGHILRLGSHSPLIEMSMCVGVWMCVGPIIDRRAGLDTASSCNRRGCAYFLFFGVESESELAMERRLAACLEVLWCESRHRGIAAS